jgi:hypothetical protein
MTSVPERLAKLGDLFKERGQIYGDDYKNAGDMYAAMFPRGLTLTTPEQFNRFSLFIHLAAKVARYAQSEMKKGHVDSLDDISVYAQMMQECDAEDSQGS